MGEQATTEFGFVASEVSASLHHPFICEEGTSDNGTFWLDLHSKYEVSVIYTTLRFGLWLSQDTVLVRGYVGPRVSVGHSSCAFGE